MFAVIFRDTVWDQDDFKQMKQYQTGDTEEGHQNILATSSNISK